MQEVMDAGVLHGDLTTSNILVFPHPRTGTLFAKLIDFGAGSFVKDGPLSPYSGVPELAPPECSKRGSYDPEAAAVWTLGHMLYHMATGTFAFLDADFSFNPTFSFEEFGRSLRCKRVIARCMQTRPKDRPSIATLVRLIYG